VAANPIVVRSLRETYTRAQLLGAREKASEDLLAGVQITQIALEGANASGRPISGDPSYVLEHIQAAIDLHDDPDHMHRPNSASFDLSKRPWGT
jgi:hypothetical protein